MNLKYNKIIEIGIKTIKQILNKNIDYEISNDDENFTRKLPIYFDNKMKDVNYILYGLDRSSENIEISSLLPSGSLKLTNIKPIDDFKLQKGLNFTYNGKNEYTPNILELLFSLKIYCDQKSTLFNILQQIITLFDPEYNFKIYYPDYEKNVDTQITLLDSDIELEEEQTEEDDIIQSFECNFKLRPLILPKIKKEQKDLTVHLTFEYK